MSGVIAGEFGGWSRGLLEGGFGGLFVATLIVTVMYACLVLSLSEMSAAMPFVGASYAYARAALGPWSGFLAGIAQVIEYTLSVALTVVPVATVLRATVLHLAGLDVPEPVWWLVLYAVFLFLNAYDVALFFRTAIVLSIVSIAILALFWVFAVPHFELRWALDMPPGPHGNAWLPNGLTGVAWAIPFAVWFYLAVEQVPMAAEEARDPARTIYRGMLWGLGTIAVAAFLTLFLNAGVDPGADDVGAADDPLRLGLQTVLHGRIGETELMLMATVGAIANIHSVMFGSGRSIFTLARSGYLPPALAKTLPNAGTPHVALIAAAALGLFLIGLVKFSPADVPMGAVLLNMSVFGALISYVFQFVSFIALRQKYPDMPRPYRSPFGATGAMTGLVISGASFILLFSEPSYRPGLFGCVVLYAVGIVYFQVYAKHRLKSSPEEDFAVALAATRRPDPADAALARAGETIP